MSGRVSSAVSDHDDLSALYIQEKDSSSIQDSAPLSSTKILKFKKSLSMNAALPTTLTKQSSHGVPAANPVSIV